LIAQKTHSKNFINSHNPVYNMNKKIIAVIGMVVLLGVVVVVSAIQKSMDFPGTTLSREYVETTASFYKGWNIIWGLPNPGWLSGAELVPENIKAIYALYPGTNEYVRFHPEPELEKIKDSNFRWDTYTNIGAFWVYSNKEAIKEEYWVMNPAPIDSTQLIKGWNFIGITPEMMGKTLDDFKGTCNIQKAYFWSAPANRWFEFSLSEIIVEDYEGTGLVIKVSSDCNLGSSTTSPPGLPGDNLGDWNNYIYEGNVRNLEHFDTDTANECFWFEEESCEYYKADYGKKVGSLTHIYGGFVEVHDTDIDTQSFINRIEAKYTEVKKGDFSGNDYYILEIQHDSGTSVNVFWVSGDKVVGTSALDKYDDNLDEIEDLLGIYLPKYPSDLNWN